MQRERNSKGYWLMYGMYKKALPHIKEHFKFLRGLDDEFRLRSVSYKVFYTVVTTYLTIVFERILAGERVKLYGKNKYIFQSLQIVKAKPMRYLPTLKRIRRMPDGKYKVYEKELNLSATDGFAYFVFWNTSKMYRTHKLYAHGVWKQKYLNKVRSGEMDYEDKTLPTGTWADYKILKSMQCNEVRE